MKVAGHFKVYGRPKMTSLFEIGRPFEKWSFRPRATFLKENGHFQKSVAGQAFYRKTTRPFWLDRSLFLLTVHFHLDLS